MTEEMWVAIITGGLALAGTVITVVWGNKKSEKRQKESDAERKEQNDLVLYRIDELEKKQDKYNHLQERTYKDEQDIAVIKKDIRSIRERMDYLHKE